MHWGFFFSDQTRLWCIKNVLQSLKSWFIVYVVIYQLPRRNFLVCILFGDVTRCKSLEIMEKIHSLLFRRMIFFWLRAVELEFRSIYAYTAFSGIPPNIFFRYTRIHSLSLSSSSHLLIIYIHIHTYIPSYTLWKIVFWTKKKLPLIFCGILRMHWLLIKWRFIQNAKGTFEWVEKAY